MPDVLSSRLVGAAAGVGGGSRSDSGKAAGEHTRLLGSLGIPGGLHGDVWSHGDFAYVDMQVISVATDSFTGDLLAVGLQNCFLEGEPPGLTGIDLWDVTDPTSPSRLGFFDVAPTDGVHEISLTKQVVGGTERVVSLAAVPFSEVVTSLVFGADAASPTAHRPAPTAPGPMSPTGTRAASSSTSAPPRTCGSSAARPTRPAARATPTRRSTT
ncbi:MAG TPA: hypothetical protein VE466_01555, partial [Acidimicrobiales bacterium]|nr:hypothetical protein [Acidimicrobiales bacterium]